MKRFHVHITVEDLAANIAFYSKLLDRPPSKAQSDYAKWMLNDPPVNLAISARGHRSGVNHLGVQVDDATELDELRERAAAVSGDEVRDSGETACCYARSEKHWTVDPQGIAWEHFLTMNETDTFGADEDVSSTACCIPLRSSDEEAAGCCVPRGAEQSESDACCS